MQLLFTLLAAVVALVLLCAAFVYLVDIGQARHLLGKLRPVLLVALAAFVIIALVQSADYLQVLVGLSAVSITAYLIRESRKPKREKRRVSGGAERTPVVPVSTRRANQDHAEEEP